MTRADQETLAGLAEKIGRYAEIAAADVHKLRTNPGLVKSNAAFAANLFAIEAALRARAIRTDKEGAE